MTKNPRSKSLTAVFTTLWRDVGGTLRRLIQALLVVGILVVALGMIGDWKEWWPTHPFLTNLASSLGTGCFGVPVAVLFIQYFLRVQEAKSIALRLLERVHENWLQLAGKSHAPRELKKVFSYLRQAGQCYDRMPEDAVATSAILGPLARDLYSTWQPPSDTLEIIASVEEGWWEVQQSLARFAEVGLPRLGDPGLNAVGEGLATLKSMYVSSVPVLANSVVGLARHGVIPRVYQGALVSEASDLSMSEIECITTFLRVVGRLALQIHFLENALARVRREVVDL